MNSIFVCVFNQEKFVDMLYLLLESAFIYGNLMDDTHILIYTSTPFMKKIKESHLYNDKIIFEINDGNDNIDKACKSRLDIFHLRSIKNYKKIIYLDTDILIKDDIHKVFDLCKEDILYVVKEGDITDPHDYWGRSLFGDEINEYDDKSAFSSGMLLFNNCEKIRELFENIKIDMTKRNHYFNDQPFFVYNAFKYKIYNNTILTQLAINNSENTNSDKVIHHFPGIPGKTDVKITVMTKFLNKLKDNTINKNIENAKEYINKYLLPIIRDCNDQLEGSIFMCSCMINYTDRFINKTKNTSNLVLNKNIQNVMEIGFNEGFAALLMLLSNPTIRIRCFNLGQHKHTIPCYKKLRETFGNRIELIVSNSMKTVSCMVSGYDLIHIDGGQTTDIAMNNIECSYKLSKYRSIFIMDDYDFPNLHELWDTYTKKYNLKPLHINVYPSPHHDVKYMVKRI